MASIQEILEIFERFGIDKSDVIFTLNQCKTKSEAFNRFEGFKCLVIANWEQMKDGLNEKEREELLSSYDRLMGISLSNYKPPKPPVSITPHHHPSPTPKPVEHGHDGIKQLTWEMVTNHPELSGKITRQHFDRITSDILKDGEFQNVKGISYEEILRVLKSSPDDRDRDE